MAGRGQRLTGELVEIAVFGRGRRVVAEPVEIGLAVGAGSLEETKRNRPAPKRLEGCWLLRVALILGVAWPRIRDIVSLFARLATWPVGCSLHLTGLSFLGRTARPDIRIISIVRVRKYTVTENFECQIDLR